MTATVRGSGLQGYAALMRSLACAPEALLARHGISPAVLTDEDALLPLRAGVQLLETSALATGCADFGLRLSQVQDVNVLGPLAILLQNAPTVRAAWDCVARHMFVHSPGLVVEVRDSGTIAGAVEMTVAIRLARPPAQRQTMDLCLGNMHHITQLLAGPAYRLLAVSLPHAILAPMAVYRRFFAARILTQQPRAALHLARQTLAAELPHANPALRRIAHDYLERNFRDPGASTAARVRLALRRTLGTPGADKTGVAALLAMHPRTLQRHLKAENTSFETLREEARSETALHYLRQTRIPLAQLADMLGFSQQSAMTRSCRRWFGHAPSELRRGAGDAADSSF